MLTRAAARRRHPHPRLYYDACRVKAPWLCPSSRRWQPKLQTPVQRARCQSSASLPTRTATAAVVTTQAESTPQRHYPYSSPVQTTRRHLATYMGEDSSSSLNATASSDSEYIPFEGISPIVSPLSSATSPSTLKSQTTPAKHTYQHHALRPLDLENLVDVPNGQSTDHLPILFRRPRHLDMAGDMETVQQNLYACVQVGRFDRAALLVKRIVEVFETQAPQVYDAHHRYLSGLLEDLIAYPSIDKFNAMRKWFELEIRATGIVIDHRILSIMLKAALTVLDGGRLDRTIRRYLQYAEECGPSTIENTLLPSLLTVQDCNRVFRADPTRFNKPPEEMFMADVEDDSTFGSLELISVDHNSSSSIRKGHGGVAATIRATEQKGLGLKSLQKSLSVFNDNFSSDIEIQPRNGEDYQTARQRRLEEDVLITALERWREEAKATQELRNRGVLVNPKLGSFVHEWIQEMIVMIEKEIQSAEQRDTERWAQERDEYGFISIVPFLRMIEPEKLAASTILAFTENVLSLPAHFTTGPSNMIPVAAIVNGIGRQIINESKAASKISTHTLQKLSGLPLPERKRMLAKAIRQREMSSTTPSPQSSGDSQSSGTSVGVDSAEPGTTISDNTAAIVREFQITDDIRIRLGVFCLSMLLKVAKLPVPILDNTQPVDSPRKQEYEFEPIAKRSWIWTHGREIGVIKCSEELMKRLKNEPLPSSIAKHLPMIVPPRPWKSLNEGGYLTSGIDAVRLRDSSRSQKEYLRIADSRGNLKGVFSSLNVIGKTPWKVNEPLFNVMTQVWNTGEKITCFAPQNAVANLPPEPELKDIQARRRWASIVRDIENEVGGLHSQRCYQNFQLVVARAFLKETFYCPHTIDFRGRAYPVPPYFNHMGSDFVRALFQFADGKELGASGLRWLKIHLANVFGYDKASLQDRETFADDHILDIYDSVENPLDGNRWWLTAEDPWQCLAACMELKAALDSPVPSLFVSHLPVQQDGSCNGLQHYAALGGDEIGAQQVNLTPGDRPADIYAAVSKLVSEYVAQDAASGECEEAKILDGRITRKVVKQPVMTNVYGVTFRGASEQVRKQLLEILPKATLENNINMHKLSFYVARLIFRALGQMFFGAQAIQDWLGECSARVSTIITPQQIQRARDRLDNTAEMNRTLSPSDIEDPSIVQKTRGRRRIHAKQPTKYPTGYNRQLLKAVSAGDPLVEDAQFKSSVVWTTPLGLPVVQPYRETRVKRIKTNLQEISYKTSTASDPVSKRKQLQGFAPNFIHSLDATHMMLSALKCDELGLTFASVHDSFWSHASSVDTMSDVLRDAFVRMHSEDIVGRLREEFTARYKGCVRLASVRYSHPIASKLKAHFKSKQRGAKHWNRNKVVYQEQVVDLIEEYDRLALLESENPDDQARGRAMVTAGSIFEEYMAQKGTNDNVEAPAILHQQTASPRASEEEQNQPLSDREATNTWQPPTDDVGDVNVGDDIDGEQTLMTPLERLAEESNAAAELNKFPEHPQQNDDDSGNVSSSKAKELDTSTPPSAEKPKKEPRNTSKVHFWLPLSIPQPPPRGTFDVSRLRDSKYFFS